MDLGRYRELPFISVFLVDEHDGEEQFEQFADELEERVQGRVGVETIDWIWDEMCG